MAVRPFDLHGIISDQLPVDEGSVGAIQIFEEGVVENGNDGRMLAADRQVST